MEQMGFLSPCLVKDGKMGKFKDVVHPLNKETREKIEELIFKEYKAQISSMGTSIENL